MQDSAASVTLFDEVQRFLNYNPNLTGEYLQYLYDRAVEVDAGDFVQFAGFAGHLINGYLNCPNKLVGKRIVEDYLKRLEQKVGKGEENTVNTASTTALVPHRIFSALEFFKALDQARLPSALLKAVEANRERSQMIASVMEFMFRILHFIDSDKSFAWGLNYLQSNRGQLDPDVIRDFLRCWRSQESVPQEALEWAMQWAGDENLLRHWPVVVEEADSLLRIRVIRELAAKECVSGPLKHLTMIAEAGFPMRRMIRWLDGTARRIGESIDSFVRAASSGDDSDELKRRFVFGEIRMQNELFLPFLVCSDIMLSRPEGGYNLALALFGLAGEGWTRWYTALNKSSEKMILRTFLADMRAGSTPVETIRKLSFGDKRLFAKQMERLDLISSQFDSLEEREKTIRDLAVYYTSYRRQNELEKELTRRYRNFMRVFHEDNLRRVLSAEQFTEAMSLDVLSDINALTGNARKFLEKRRSLHLPLEELLATGEDFSRAVRIRRLNRIRKFLSE